MSGKAKAGIVGTTLFAIGAFDTAAGWLSGANFINAHGAIDRVRDFVAAVPVLGEPGFQATLVILGLILIAMSVLGRFFAWSMSPPRLAASTPAPAVLTRESAPSPTTVITPIN